MTRQVLIYLTCPKKPWSLATNIHKQYDLFSLAKALPISTWLSLLQTNRNKSVSNTSYNSPNNSEMANFPSTCLSLLALTEIKVINFEGNDMLQIIDHSRLRVGKNILTNHLRVLNNKVRLEWLNQTYEWFKLKSKTTFMPQWQSLNNCFNNNNY